MSAVVDANKWELYNIATDRNEEQDLAAKDPDRLKQMIAKWEAVDAEYAAKHRQAVPNPAPGRPGRNQPKAE